MEKCGVQKEKRGVQNFAKSQCTCNDADFWINHLIILYFPNSSQLLLTIWAIHRIGITFDWSLVLFISV